MLCQTCTVTTLQGVRDFWHAWMHHQMSCVYHTHTQTRASIKTLAIRAGPEIIWFKVIAMAQWSELDKYIESLSSLVPPKLN